MVSANDTDVEIIVGGMWLFLGSIVISLSGFLMWVVITHLADVSAVGSASTAISAVGVATTIVASGLPIATVREFAARGLTALRECSIVTLLLGVASTLLAVFLAVMIPSSLGVPVWLVPLLTFFNVIGLYLLRIIVGLGFFKRYFTSVFLASLMKLIVAVILCVLGWGLLAPLIGYLTYLLIIITVSIAWIALIKLHFNHAGGGAGSGLNFYKTTGFSFLKLVFSNYPFSFSTQLLNMLSVYSFAVISGIALNVGILYISLMIVMLITSLVFSVFTASLSVSLRNNGGDHSFGNILRISLVLSSLIACVVSVAPTLPLYLINPKLSSGAITLSLLALSVPPATVITASIMKANEEGKHRDIMMIGLVRLVTLVLALAILSPLAGTEGVGIAYVLANTIPLFLDSSTLGCVIKLFPTLWCLQTLLTLTSIAVGIGNLGVSTVLGLMSFLVLVVAVGALDRSLLGDVWRVIRVSISSVMKLKG